MAVKILVPRANDRDVLGAEVFLGALSARQGLALEIAAVRGERMFVLRGARSEVERAMAQVRVAWPQADFETLSSETDPASLMQDGVVGGVELRLAKGMYLPLRTHITREGRLTNDDLSEAADPLMPVLAALDTLDAGEAVIVQLSLSPMPPDWSRLWRGNARDVGARAGLAPDQVARRALLTLALVAGTLTALLVVVSQVLTFGALWPTAISSLVVAAICVWAAFRLPAPADGEVVRQKVFQSAFRVQLRAYMRATSAQAGEARMESLCAALSGYDHPAGNQFVAQDLPSAARVDQVLLPEQELGLRAQLAAYFARPRRVLPILSVGELAVLWHLPHQRAALQDVRMVATRRLQPLRHMVEHGALIGHSRLQGKDIAVRLGKTALSGNIGLLAKTQSGKSNAMTLICEHLLRDEPDAAILLIDPHRTLAEAVARTVPEARRASTVYWSLAEQARPFGLNLLDANLDFGATVGKRIDDLIGTLKDIWPDNWGPRMETFFRGPLLTMVHANRALLRDTALAGWVAFAQAVVTGNREQVQTGTLDARARDMFDAVFAQLRTLPKPGRKSLAEQHAKYMALADNWAMCDDDETRATVASALHASVARKDETARPGQRGEALLKRMFGNPPAPLQYTLLDVNAMLMNSAFHQQALQGLDERAEPQLFNWWREAYNTYRDLNVRLLLDMTTPVTTKVTRFATSDVARRIFGQSNSTIDVSALLERGGVLLIDLAAGVVGQDTAALVGATVLGMVSARIFARSTPRPLYIVVDEFQSVPGADYAFMLSELAKYGVKLILGTQSLKTLAQVSPRTATSWLHNTTTLLAFNCAAEDAEVMARELSTSAEDALTVTASDLVGLGAHECYVRARDDAHTPFVFRVATELAPRGERAVFEQIWLRSLAEHGRPVAEVDDELYAAIQFHGQADLSSPGAQNRRTPPSVEASQMGILEEDEAIEQRLLDAARAATKQKPSTSAWGAGAFAGHSEADIVHELLAIFRTLPESEARILHLDTDLRTRAHAHALKEKGADLDALAAQLRELAGVQDLPDAGLPG